MCGIAGIWTDPRKPELVASDVRAVGLMAGSLAHRGPDDNGEWSDPAAGIVLAHRRLSIVDLSNSARQPMHSSTGRYVVTFNGEIYNFRRIRPELEKLGAKFTGCSDTEVMLAAIEQWGLQAALSRFIGMFALAVWDRSLRRLYLVKDRLGKKPIYFTVQKGRIAFGSELKALAAHRHLDLQIDLSSAAAMLQTGFVPSPYTIYKGVRQVLGGQIVEFALDSDCQFSSRQYHYWLQPAWASSVNRNGTIADAEAMLEELLTDATSLRMVADVPVGAFLSGGIDSSIVVSLMQRQAQTRVRTYTVAFEDAGLNEADYARAVATHIGTDHTEMILTAKEAADVAIRLHELYDEPFGDASQIPTHIVSRLARSTVTVALTGDGGDELFCGYSRYFKWRQFWRLFRLVPAPIRGSLGGLLSCFARDAKPSRASTQFNRLATALSGESQDALYRVLLSQWTPPPLLLESGEVVRDSIAGDEQTLPLDDYTRRMCRLDLEGYLRDDILVKVDRASMAVALETRAPLLDHRVVEYAASLPTEFLIDKERGKLLLRRLAYRYVPRQLLDRPKAGFGVPMASWLRGSMRQWAEELLSEHRLRDFVQFDIPRIRAMWESHVSQRADFGAPLWNVLMFQSWFQNVRSRITT